MFYHPQEQQQKTNLIVMEVVEASFLNILLNRLLKWPKAL
jgi:hypothetical protein